MYLSPNEKTAIFWSVSHMMGIDGTVDRSELKLVFKILEIIQISESERTLAETISENAVLSIIKSMPYEKRKLLSALLHTVMVIDGGINPNELVLLWAFQSNANLPELSPIEARDISADFLEL